MKIKYVSLEAAAFISDTDWQSWDAETRGVYDAILYYMYANNGRLSSDEDGLRRIANANNFEKCWQKVKKKFSEKNGLLQHKRVRKEMAQARRFFKRQQKAGLASAKSRHHGINHGSTPDEPGPNQGKVSKGMVCNGKKGKKEGPPLTPPLEKPEDRAGFNEVHHAFMKVFGAHPMFGPDIPKFINGWLKDIGYDKLFGVFPKIKGLSSTASLREIDKALRSHVATPDIGGLDPMSPEGQRKLMGDSDD